MDRLILFVNGPPNVVDWHASPLKVTETSSVRTTAVLLALLRILLFQTFEPHLIFVIVYFIKYNHSQS